MIYMCLTVCFSRINSLVQGDGHATHGHEAGNGSVTNSISRHSFFLLRVKIIILNQNQFNYIAM